jgi:hypothetical protein
VIDVEWLRTVQFDTKYGHVTGLAGIGSQFIVFNHRASGKDLKLGKDTVMKILNTPKLGFHIREIPPELELTPTYDAQRVNRKLRAHVGNPLYDSMVGPYNGLYEYIIAILREGGLTAVTSMIDDETSAAFFTYFLNTPGLHRRIEDVAFLDAAGDPREVVTWNGLLRAIEEPRETVSAWARSMLHELKSVHSLESFPPARLSENPYWIWGGAVLDGFFTSEEMADAVHFIADNFGALAVKDDGPRLRFEMMTFLSLLTLVANNDELQRLTEFCNLAGFQFVLPDLGSPSEDERSDEPLEGQPIGRMPNLSPPSTVPKFPEEGRIDPMAQDPRLLTAAAAIFADFTARMTSTAHGADVAVMLPQADSESAEYWKPWRSVVPVRNSASAPASAANEPPELCLTQRLLTSAQAVVTRTGGAAPDGLAELIEEIGYVAIGRSHDIADRPKLNACRSIGRMAAAMHRAGFVHGDLQPQNFMFKENGEIESMFDLGRACNPGRPLTLLECASDLAVLKRHISFLEWEAAKFGYRSEAADADEVLAQFEQHD